MTPEHFISLATQQLAELEAFDGFKDCCRRPGKSINVSTALGSVPASDPNSTEHFPALFVTCASCGYTRTYFVGSLGLMRKWNQIEW